MNWTKYTVEPGQRDRYIPLPVGREDNLEDQAVYAVLLLTMAFCDCHLVDFYNDGFLQVYDDIPNIDVWSTSDLSAVSGNEAAKWSFRVFDRFYKPLTRKETSAAEVR